MKKNDVNWLRMAVELAKKCIPSTTAFCVGAVIVDEKGKLVSTGYSRETVQNKHAEEIAIEKAIQIKADLAHAAIYSSLEPCGERLSGKKSCVQRIIETGIKRVIFAEYEPSIFVKGEGEELLKKAGIEVYFLKSI